jgi:hypothetical protein
MRAQWPIVPGANLTFEAASSSAASDREIQSAGGFDIAQSAPFGAVSLDFSPGLSPDFSLEDPLDSFGGADASPDEGLLSLDAGLDGRAAPRSLRAQPDPLKWTAAATIALRMCPPHLGQADGPWPATEWMTSISWPQLVQT